MLNYFDSFELTVIVEQNLSVTDRNSRNKLTDDFGQKISFQSLPLEPVDPIDDLSGLRRKAFAPAVLTGGDSLKLGD